jgi:plastocyanin
MMRVQSSSRFRLLAVVPGTVLLLALGGCNIKHPTDNLVRGKQLFVARCGACHTLSHAASTGTIGPNLDAAFYQSLKDGMKRDTIRGIVDFQIRYPNPYGGMPAGLFEGSAVGDVAGYVAAVAAAPGQDTGALATAVVTISQHPVIAKNGVLAMAADPTGQLKFDVSSATATAGKLAINMTNKSSVPHDIAIKGNGVNVIGPVVSNGGVSTVSTTLPAGTYEFYCSVPGHEAAGMKGTLTIK